MLNKLILFIALLFLFNKSYCQTEPNRVLAKYKNGLTYVGELISENGDISAIRINTMDTIHIDRTQLSRYYNSESALIFDNGKYIQTKGGFWDLSFGFNALGVLDSVDQRVSTHLEVLYGRRLSDDLNIGVGLGFEFNEARVAGFQFDTQFTSLFAYGRYYLNRSSKRWFVFSRLGFGFPDEEAENTIVEHSSGFNTLNGIGLHFASRKRSTFHIALGFYTQKTDGREFFLDNIGNEIQTDFDILIKRLMFKFGWEFG